MSEQQVGTVVIGGSQAGLAVGYHLRRRHLPFVILDDNARIGDVWRKRWDSLRLFTPGRYDGLPGMRFPGSPSSYPTKDEIADFTPMYEWIDLALPTHNGVPIHDRGIVESCPGLYFMGLPFQYSLSSALLGGMGRDAEHIVDGIERT